MGKFFNNTGITKEAVSEQLIMRAAHKAFERGKWEQQNWFNKILKRRRRDPRSKGLFSWKSREAGTRNLKEGRDRRGAY